VVRPNADTVYSALFVDISDSDLVITIPEIDGDRYWVTPFYDLYVTGHSCHLNTHTERDRERQRETERDRERERETHANTYKWEKCNPSHVYILNNRVVEADTTVAGMATMWPTLGL
jgi:hypothetical protein